MIEPAARVFISYSRSDLEYARALRDGLIAAELAVWHDLKDIGTGQWWSQIAASIAGRAAVEHLVLLVSPAALASKIVEREWRLARREGKTASLVVPPEHKGKIEFDGLPGWMRAQHFFDLTHVEQFDRLTAVLRGPGQQAKRPMMAPPLPEAYVHRPIEFNRLKSALLEARGEPVAITAALRGAGGFGKTVVAAALARDEDIQDTFFDGVLWVTLGERPNVVQSIAELIYVVMGERSAFTEPAAAAHRLKEVLEHHHCLLIVDDVWQESHLRSFTDGAVTTTRLITTRRDDIVPPQASRIVVDAMTASEAVAILAWGLAGVGSTPRPALERLASERLGEWPILLSLVNGFLRSRVERGEPLEQAIIQVSERMDRRGLVAFDRTLDDERTAAVEKTVGVGLQMLAEFDQSGRPAGFHAARYGELAVFPEDVEVPIATIMRLWERLGAVDRVGAEELLERLYGLALLQALDLKRRTVRLHDVMRKYLCDRLQGMALKELHARMVDAFDSVNGEDLSDAEERRYFFGYLPTHLAEAGQRDVVDALLVDPQWMQRKLRTVGLQGLMSDYEAYARQEGAEFVRRTLDLTGRIVARDMRQLLPQLVGRLAANDDANIATLLQRSQQLIVAPALVTKRPTLLAPSSEIRRLEGHGAAISALAMIDDRRALSGASDHTMRLWNVETSELLARFEGQERHRDSGGRITAILALAGGQALVASADGVLGHWDIETETLLARWQLGWAVHAMAEFEPGKILLGLEECQAGTLMQWDLRSGELIWQGGPKFAITGFLRLDDKSRYAMACDNRHVLLWDIVNEQVPQQWAGHEWGVTCLARVDERHIVSGSFDQTLIVWDLETGEPVRRLRGHRDHVTAVCALDQGRVLSGSRDGTLRVWDCRSGRELWRLEGQSSEIWCMAQVNERHVISGGSDRVLRLWNVEEPRQLRGPAPARRVLSALAITDEDRVVAADAKGGLRILRAGTGEELGSIDGHRVGIAYVMMLRESIGASVDFDGKIACWDASTCRLIAALQPRHWSLPSAACAVDAGRLLIAYDDGSLFLCEPERGRSEQLEAGRGGEKGSEASEEAAIRKIGDLLKEQCEKGGDPLIADGYIRAMARMADGRILVLRRDGSLGVLNVEARKEATLANSMPVGREMLLLDGEHAIVRSDTSRQLVLIDLATGVARGLAEHNDDITAMAVLTPSLVVTAARRLLLLWEMPSGRELARLECDSQIECLAVLHDGRSVLAGDMHGRLHEVEARLSDGSPE